jgi:hypothetical protein
MSDSPCKKAVLESVKAHVAASQEPHKLGAIDPNSVINGIGTIDEVVEKLYPIFAPFLPGNAQAIANIIISVLHVFHPAPVA